MLRDTRLPPMRGKPRNAPHAKSAWIESIQSETNIMMTFIYYPKCTTCQKAKKWLDDNNIEYTPRDIKLDPPSLQELKDFHAKSGLPLKKFFNTSGMLYRSLNLKDKLPSMTESECYELLASDGMLVKRPLFITETAVLVGFKEAEWNCLK